eukprot:Rmarinus@m.1969
MSGEDGIDRVPSEMEVQANQIKEEANANFKQNKINLACDQYSQAIELCPTAALYSNRAFCHIKLELYGAALEDASKAIELDPAFIKAYYRRATAKVALGKLKDAKKDLQFVTKIKPGDKDAKQKLASVEKQLKTLAFEKAIESEATRPVSETIDTSSMEVPSTYPLAQLTWPITKEYVLQTMEDFRQEKKIHPRYVLEILLEVKKLLSRLPNIAKLEVPESSDKFTVCGDVHGQYYDLLNIFERNGVPSPDNPYLFNGDFVDRGSFSVETVLTLFMWKLYCPDAIHLSRGNHESVNMNKMFGFEHEVLAKYSDVVMALFTEVFRCLPLGAVIGEKVLCVHGGLFSRPGVTLDEIQKVNRFCEPADEGIVADVLWSDPHSMPGRRPSKRGVGVGFGADVTKEFLDQNNLSLLVRSHEMKEQGYEVQHDGKCITIFSAPNYCDQMGNLGAYIHFNRSLEPKFETFAAVPHPNVRPMAYVPALNRFMM